MDLKTILVNPVILSKKSFVLTRLKYTYFRFHALRHFGASIMKHKGVSTGAIQKILGHEKSSTTDIYLQAIEQSEREAIEVLERELEEKLEEDEGNKDSLDNSKTAHKTAHKIKEGSR